MTRNRWVLNLLLQSHYDQFLTVVRIWRHLKGLKRAGRGHDPAGIAATQPGQCTVKCPACPHPDRNLPSNWRTVPENIRYEKYSFSPPVLNAILGGYTG